MIFISYTLSFTCFLPNSSAYLSKVSQNLVFELIPPTDYESSEYAACKSFQGLQMKGSATIGSIIYKFDEQDTIFKYEFNTTMKVVMICTSYLEHPNGTQIQCSDAADTFSTVEYKLEIQGTTYELTDQIGNYYVTYYDRRNPFLTINGQYDLTGDKHQLYDQFRPYTPGIDFEPTKSKLTTFFGSENFTNDTSGKLDFYRDFRDPIYDCDLLNDVEKELCIAKVRKIMSQDFSNNYILFEFEQSFSRWNNSADADSAFKIWSRFFQNHSSLEPSVLLICYEGLVFVNKGNGLALRYLATPQARVNCDENSFMLDYKTSENETMFVLDGSGYESSEIILKHDLTQMGSQMDCSMTKDPAKCLQVLRNMNHQTLEGSLWAIALLKPGTNERIVKLRQSAALAVECANVGTLEVDTSVAVFTITDYSCSGAQRNQSARLIIRQGIEVLIVSSTNALYPNKTITFENITGLYDALQKSDNVYVQIADEVVAVQSFSTKLQIAFNPKVYITTGAVTAVITIITGVVFLFLV